VSPRGFVILLAVTLLAVLGAALLAVQPTLSGADPVSGEPMFPALGPRLADAATVTVTTPQYEVSWARRDGAWVSPERGDYPARASLVADLVVNLARLTRLEARTARPDWYQYIRVGDPTATPPTGVARVTVATAAGEVLADGVLGARSFSIAASHGRGGSFVRPAAGAQSWLVEGTAPVPTELPEWFDTLIDIPGPEIAAIAVLEGDRTLFEANKTDRTNGIYTLAYADPAQVAADVVANTNTLRSMASALVGLRVSDVRARASVVPGEAVRTDRFTTTSGLTLDVQLVEADGGTWALFTASAPAGGEGAARAAEITARTSDWAFRLDASRATRLGQPLANLVQPPAPAAGATAPSDAPPLFVPPGTDLPGRNLLGAPAP
jgi:hypothetical protein